MKHDVYWGSHGCHRGKGHTGPCACEHLASDLGPERGPEDGDDWLLLTREWHTFGDDEPQYADWWASGIPPQTALLSNWGWYGIARDCEDWETRWFDDT